MPSRSDTFNEGYSVRWRSADSQLNGRPRKRRHGIENPREKVNGARGLSRLVRINCSPRDLFAASSARGPKINIEIGTQPLLGVSIVAVRAESR